MDDFKICSKCHSENQRDAKFCRECGKDLSQGQEICQICESHNSIGARFCFNCGNELGNVISKKKQSNPGEKTSRNIPPAKQPVTNSVKIAGVLLAIIVIYLIIPEDKASSTTQPIQQVQPVAEQKLADPSMESLVLDIASKFICSCGTCGEQPLNSCTCEMAQVERQFIRNSLQNKKEPDTIIKEVNEKYGWIKPQFEDQYGKGKFRFDSKNIPIPGLNILGQKSEISLATFDDRIAIISSFACTCGQCQIYELKDCSCEHSGGAIEVKQMIDLKIQEEKFSKENIIQLVEARYGERIR